MSAFVGVWFRVRILHPPASPSPDSPPKYLGGHRPGDLEVVDEPLAYCYGSPGDANRAALRVGLHPLEYEVEAVPR